MAAEVGENAPDFTLPADGREPVSLEECTREGPVALFFYPGDWSSVCTDQMSQIRQASGRFESLGEKVLATGADTPWSHRAFAEDRGIEALLSDFGGEAIEAYGVRHGRGFPERAYFIMAQECLLRAKRVEPSPKSQPDLEQVPEDLQAAL